ncbi:MAG: MmcQ/YjbR family DNA-binding protein [Pseudomonadota bacterium]
MHPHPDVAPEVVDRLRRICMRLPGASEERAWVGTRWAVRRKVFAHLLHIEGGWPPAYAHAAHARGPLDVLTFRSPAAEFNAYSFAAPPFFRPGWWPNIVGMALDTAADWEEVEMLVVASWRVLAPKRLLAAAGDDALPGADPPG